MQVTIESTPVAVRQGLITLLACPAVREMDVCARGTAELVLAEVLNNIVEHAYAEKTGSISVRLSLLATGVEVVVTDQGQAFPHGELPQGKLPPINDMQNMAEGGFGWHLIRSLVRDLTYRREQATNHLTFVLPIKTSTEKLQ
jgi:serine/threonine-protein kinase RsbW